MSAQDEAAKQEQRLHDRVTIECRTIRKSIVTMWEAATIAADQTTDPEVRAELLNLKNHFGDSLEAIEQWLTLADRDDWECDAARDDEPPDFETLQAQRDERDYQQGRAEGELRRAERKIYGDELAEAFDVQDELNRYNRGED